MARWESWGRHMLRQGDIVFRLGDAKVMRGIMPMSLFIARASGSPFSHTGIVVIEDGLPVVYDCSGCGVQRQPFEVWMLDCVGPMGVKRLKAEHRRHIPGVISYCRKVYEQHVPFDYEVGLDDAALYCVEMTEKAFRSQGLKLSEPVRVGDWEEVNQYFLTALAVSYCSRFTLEQPVTFEQPVYLPGNERHGIWASPLLETVSEPQPKREQPAAPRAPGGSNVRGDLVIVAVAVRELRRSYEELPLQLLGRLAVYAKLGGPDSQQANQSRLRLTTAEDAR
jgi:hypothetical protein